MYRVRSLFYCLECLFFFFFKQKTAYEMRISDWSSDVCSSDLFPNLCSICSANSTDSASIARVEIALESRESPCADRVPHRLHQRLIKMQIMLRHQHRTQHLARANEVVQIGARPGRAHGANARRSEEHTSELQSLMPNSYAVS